VVTVLIGKRAYTMTEKQAGKMLALASEQVPCGIYAVRKKNVLELKADRMSKTKIREARRHYKKLGFKVYANGV